jgi:hypothetical protein
MSLDLGKQLGEKNKKCPYADDFLPIYVDSTSSH